MVLLLCAGAWAAEKSAPAARDLFNGKDLSGWYTFLHDHGKGVDPKAVFTVADGVIRISGEEWGCITTEEEFENYHALIEFKWGEKTWANRVDAARDSGFLVHSVGEDGGYSRTWMYSIEVQMIEGGTGDLLAVGDEGDLISITSDIDTASPSTGKVYKTGGAPTTITGGRIDWWGRDLGWKDVKGFRGAQDVEHPVGEWNRLEVLCLGDRVTVWLNGRLVNECYNVKPTKGKLQIQSEGAELFVRKVQLQPLAAEE